MSLSKEELKQLAMHYTARRMTESKDKRSIIEDYIENIRAFEEADSYLEKNGYYELQQDSEDKKS